MIISTKQNRRAHRWTGAAKGQWQELQGGLSSKGHPSRLTKDQEMAHGRVDVPSVDTSLRSEQASRSAVLPNKTRDEKNGTNLKERLGGAKHLEKERPAGHF